MSSPNACKICMYQIYNQKENYYKKIKASWILNEKEMVQENLYMPVKIPKMQ